VLVVDDAEDNRLIYSEYLAFTGRFIVRTAVDGLDALAKVKEEKPDIILMDLSLPKIDGWEATRRLKTHPSTKDICIIALTGHGETPYVDRALHVGCSHVLVKPVLPDALVSEMERVCGAVIPPPSSERRPRLGAR